ncbi:hypothetical protein AAC387_Pa02g1599 [Persea americana]
MVSSDDGTCRIWDARNSQCAPRVYIPKPPDAIAGKSDGQLPSTVQSEHRIVCCAYNANGTLFVTGSSDNYARVWNAVKCNQEDFNQPNHEMDVLSGHENDVNYVQFSGCAVPSRSSTSDSLKEENLRKFKNSWFTHDNLVTCSRDGSAIIWIPGSRKSHGKVGHWMRTYHLKVPLPPLPPCGGPRQRFLPTPRGVNMIVWSLDNRFVLAAITDCRICVWNAADGSLVHSLTGHSESAYVLDVHPFNPRIAMSAGYDGKTIVWDIWEGAPVRIYETGHFKLVDGKFAPDGTSILLSDDVGQIYILASGEGESHKAAMYDQFFLGDYRPLIQDAQGNVLDQETQLAPYRRNIQDLLCDSSMSPYPEPYQNIYQQRRLGALDLERWVEPLPEFVDTVDWEQQNDAQSDDTDSEYNVPEEYATEAEQGSVSACSRSLDCSDENSEDAQSVKEGLRKSKRQKLKAKVQFTANSLRRLKRRKLYECDGMSLKNNRRKNPKHRKSFSKKRRSSTSKSLRPKRLAARNALNLFSRINGASVDEEDDQSSESDLSRSDSTSNRSNESDRALQKVLQKHPRENEASIHEIETQVKRPILPDPQINTGNRRLVLKLHVRAPNMVAPSENRKPERSELGDVTGLSDKSPSEVTFQNQTHSSSQGPVPSYVETDGALMSQSCGGTKIRWRCMSKCFSSADTTAACPASNIHLDGHNSKEEISNGHPKLGDERGMVAPNSVDGTHGGKMVRTSACAYEKRAHSSDILDKRKDNELDPGYIHKSLVVDNISIEGQGENRTSPEDKTETWRTGNDYEDLPGTSQCRVYAEPLGRLGMLTDNKSASDYIFNSSTDQIQEVKETTQPIIKKIKIISKRSTKEPQGPSSKLNTVTSAEDLTSSGLDLMSKSHMQMKQDLTSGVPEDDDAICRSGPGHGNWNDCRKNQRDRVTLNAEDNVLGEEESDLDINNCNTDQTIDFSEASADSVYRTRSMGKKATTYDENTVIHNFKMRKGHGSAGTSRNAENLAFNEHEQILCDEWKSSSKVTAGSRSTRQRRGNYHYIEPNHIEKRYTHYSVRKPSWLMLPEHEESYRYIPQQGDEVAYLIQGHREYVEWSRSHEVGPWISIKGHIRAVEFCEVNGLDYSTLPGSGESCCKLSLEFVDPSSNRCGETFKLTLPELIDFPDFIVERSRYIAAITRNWTPRDKCQVWWRNEFEEGGSWWEGRILSVKPKSPEFPDSPWERYVIQYKSDTSEQHLHSPWELNDLDSRWEHPHLDDLSRKMLLSCFAKIEQKRNQDYYGIQKLKQVAQKSDFLNRFAVPLSPEVIKRRLEKNYYRSLEAVKHDTMVMLLNAKSYFGKNAELASKIQRLSDRITCTLSSL